MSRFALFWLHPYRTLNSALMTNQFQNKIVFLQKSGEKVVCLLDCTPSLRLTLPLAQLELVPLRPYRRMHSTNRSGMPDFNKNKNVMAKKAKKSQNGKFLKLEIVNPNAAGIDVASSEMQVCVPADRSECNNRTFGTFTCDLKEIAEWLIECGVDTVAMESTGIYWLSLYQVLMSYDIDVVLCDAKMAKNITEKKTDEADAEWLMLLHSYGLLKPCFQPDNEQRAIRNLFRHRTSQIESMTQAVLLMQKSMQQMNIKLNNVISDITGKSGIAIIEEILDGERDPIKLSMLADGRCKATKEEIAKSLEGTWDEDHLFVMEQEYQHYKYIKDQIAETDKKIDSMLKRYVATPSDGVDLKKFVRSDKQRTTKNAVGFDIEMYAYMLWGFNAMQMPGISANTLIGLVGELGRDFVSKFESAEKFCRWCNLAPNTKISGGKILSSHVPRHKNPVGLLFRTGAGTLTRSKEGLGNHYRKMRSRGGGRFAHVATAHKMANSFFYMAKNKVEYDPSKIGPDEKEILMRKIARAQADLARLERKLNESN